MKYKEWEAYRRDGKNNRLWMDTEGWIDEVDELIADIKKENKKECQMKQKAVQMIMEDVMVKKDLALKRDIRHLFADCTTDWGTVDFEMFGEKVLEFISKK
jgi:hypothetical protein